MRKHRNNLVVQEVPLDRDFLVDLALHVVQVARGVPGFQSGLLLGVLKVPGDPVGLEFPLLGCLFLPFHQIDLFLLVFQGFQDCQEILIFQAIPVLQVVLEDLHGPLALVVLGCF